MIAITLIIRPHDSSLWLEFVRHRFRRFESVALENDQLLVWVPTVGSLLLIESAGSLEIQAVVHSHPAASILRARLASEVSAAVPESICGERLSLEWSTRQVDPGSAPESVAGTRSHATRDPDAIG